MLMDDARHIPNREPFDSIDHRQWLAGDCLSWSRAHSDRDAHFLSPDIATRRKPIRSSELHRSCTWRTLGCAFFKRDLLMAADHRADLGSDLYQHCPPSKELSADFENLAH